MVLDEFLKKALARDPTKMPASAASPRWAWSR
jgi:hypothetical protein